MTRSRALAVLGVLALLASTASASAYDPQQTFQKNTFVLSVEGGGGHQDSIEGHTFQTGLDFWNMGVRFGLLPFGTSGSGFFYGAFDVGLEPYYQRYTSPVHAYFAGLGASVRYHFLGLGRVVPYVEVFGAAGGTDLKVLEINSDFTFLVHGGAGLSVFVTDRVALYGGYRMQHISNGNVKAPNRGFESHTGVAGVSIFFP